ATSAERGWGDGLVANAAVSATEWRYVKADDGRTCDPGARRRTRCARCSAHAPRRSQRQPVIAARKTRGAISRPRPRPCTDPPVYRSPAGPRARSYGGCTCGRARAPPLAFGSIVYYIVLHERRDHPPRLKAPAGARPAVPPTRPDAQ